ncbi:MAG: iron-containing alcohol dehydrogenase [Alkalilacustris sp.]
MKDFSHNAAPLRLHQGSAALHRLARDMDRAGVGRAVLVTGASLAAPGALAERVRAALGPRVVAIWDGVRPHSPLPTVLAAARALDGHRADAVVALGGGSAVVTARAAAIALAEGPDLRALATHRDAAGRLRSPRLAAPKLAQFVIPTTPSTAAVKAGSAVFDPDTGGRLALFDPATRAHAVALDPDALASAPAALVADAAFNTLSLAVEGILSPSVDPLAEGALLQALRLMAGALAPAAKAPGPEGDAPVGRPGGSATSVSQDADGGPCGGQRAALAVAAALAGRGTDHAGAGLATALAHALGTRCGVGHGALGVVLLPHALGFNAGHADAAIAAVARALDAGEATAPGRPGDRLCDRLAALRTAWALPARLRDLGVPADALPEAARRAFDDWFLAGNPRPVADPGTLAGVLEAAF